MRRHLRKSVLVAVVATAVAALAETAEASVLGSLLKEGLNTLNDDSRTQIADENLNDFVDTGDIMYGVAQVEKVNGSGDPSPGGIFGIFSGQVTLVDTATYGPLMPLIHLAPTPAVSPLSVRGLLDSNLHPAGYTDTQWNQTMFAFLEHASVNDSINPFSSQYRKPGDVPPETAVIAPTLNKANGYVLDALVGSSAPGDFMQMLGLPTSAIFLDQMYGNNNGVVEISEIRNPNPAVHGTQISMYRGGFSILYEGIDELLSYKQVPIGDYSGAATNHDLVITPDGAIKVAIDSCTPNWDLEQHVNFQIDARLVPEPASRLLLWTAAASLFAVAVFRRRQRA